MKTKSSMHIPIGLLFFLLCSCNGHEKGKPPCPDIADPGWLPEVIYWQPSWHPSGDFISFNYRPLKKIEYPMQDTCFALYTFNDDSAGYWAVNPDGTNKRRLFNSYLESVDWSPDGHWIAFDLGGQIYKMNFNGVTFDTNSLYRLTNQGKNYLPSWSPDGNKIAYDSDWDSPNELYFIWTMNSDGSNKKIIGYDSTKLGNRLPSFSSNFLIAHERAVKDTNVIEIFTMDTSGQNVKRYTYDKTWKTTPKFSHTGNKIAFRMNLNNNSSGYNIWTVDTINLTIQKINDENTDQDGYSWSPDDQFIVYSYYSLKDWTLRNSTLWIVNIHSGVKRQLTFNTSK